MSDANILIKNYFLILKPLLLNERIIELHDIAPKEFWGAQDKHLETIKKYYPKLKIVARGTTLKAYGEKEELDEFENRFNRLMLHFTRYNNIDTNVIERVIQSNSTEEQKMSDHDKILVHGLGGKLIKPMTPNQHKLVELVNKNDMVFAIGPAGTGKTYTGVALAVKALKEKQVKRIILTRPAVEAGENLGFLPGDLQMKVDPYLRPLYDALFDILGPETFNSYKERGLIEIAPLAYMRGRTLDNAFIILDEAQNTTKEQMKMFLTRFGFNSKVVVNGDTTQIDLPAGRRSGLVHAIEVLKDVEEISFIYMNERDVVRHELVKKIILSYDRYEKENALCRCLPRRCCHYWRRCPQLFQA